MTSKANPKLQIAVVPNNIFGRLFIWYLRRGLNRETYKIVLRGRGGVKQRQAVKFLRQRHLAYCAEPQKSWESIQQFVDRATKPFKVPTGHISFKQSIPLVCAKKLGIYIFPKDAEACHWTAEHERRRTWQA